MKHSHIEKIYSELTIDIINIKCKSVVGLSNHVISNYKVILSIKGVSQIDAR